MDDHSQALVVSYSIGYSTLTGLTQEAYSSLTHVSADPVETLRLLLLLYGHAGHDFSGSSTTVALPKLSLSETLRQKQHSEERPRSPKNEWVPLPPRRRVVIVWSFLLFILLLLFVTLVTILTSSPTSVS
jgi:hypothetical protein